MKNDFNTYILNSLNEAVLKDGFDIDQKSKSITGITDKKAALKLLNKFEEDEDGDWVYNMETTDGKEVTFKVTSDSVAKFIENNKNKNKSEENDDKLARDFDENVFKLFGKTVGYRSALGVIKNGENFQKIAQDVMEDNSDYSLKELSNINELFDYAATSNVLHKLLKIEKNDKEQIKIVKTKLADLTVPEKRDEIINGIKQGNKERWEKVHKLFENAFAEGLKEEQQAMSKPDFEWKDPATGLPPKGVANLNKYVGKGMVKISEIGKKLESKIPAQHNLENDMARLAVLGVKCLFGVVHGAKSLIQMLVQSKYNKKTLNKEQANAKLDDVKKAIQEYKKEFNEWKKNKKNDEPKQEKVDLYFKGRLITEDKEPEDKRNILLNKFNDLMYSKVLPYYFYKISKIDNAFNGAYKMYIIEKTDEGWSTMNTTSGKLTVMEDTKILMENALKYFQTELKDVFEEFKDESMVNAIKCYPYDLVVNDKIKSDFTKWVDNLKDDKGLKKLLNLYNETVFKHSSTFKTYKDFTNYIAETLKTIAEASGITPLHNDELEFVNNDLEVDIPGIIGVKKEEPEEEQPEAPQEIKDDIYQTAKQLAYVGDNIKDPKLLDYVNKIKQEDKQIEDEISQFMNDHESVKSTYEDLRLNLGNIKDQIIPSIWVKKQILMVKQLKDSWSIQRTLQLLTEEEKPTEDNADLFELVKKITAVLDNGVEALYKTETLNDFKEKYAEWVNAIKEVYNKILSIKNDKMNNELKQYENSDPYELACACSIALEKIVNHTENKDEGNLEEKPNTDENGSESSES